MQLAVPGITYKGIDISEYAIENVIEEVKNNCLVANAKELPFEDNSISIQCLYVIFYFIVFECHFTLTFYVMVHYSFEFIGLRF